MCDLYLAQCLVARSSKTRVLVLSERSVAAGRMRDPWSTSKGHWASSQGR